MVSTCLFTATRGTQRWETMIEAKCVVSHCDTFQERENDREVIKISWMQWSCHASFRIRFFIEWESIEPIRRSSTENDECSVILKCHASCKAERYRSELFLDRDWPSSDVAAPMSNDLSKSIERKSILQWDGSPSLSSSLKNRIHDPAAILVL